MLKRPFAVTSVLKRFPNQHVAFVSCLVFIVGLLAGRAIMSIAMISLVGKAMVNKEFAHLLKTTFTDRISILFMGLFLLYAISGLWSANTAHFQSQLQLMLPFFVMPLAFNAICWPAKRYYLLLYTFITICILGAGWSLFGYLQHKEIIDAAYTVSKSMPTPFQGDHIRFGVAIVLAISFCYYLLNVSSTYRWVYVCCAIFLIFYLHLLASKTALLSFYIVSILEILRMARSKGSIIAPTLLLVSLIVLPVTFYFSSTTFRNKVNYTIYSFNELKNEKAQTNISDEGRIVSYRLAIGIIKQHLWLGVGLGDGPDQMKKAYVENNIQTQKVLNPHNQFLYTAMILGLVGFAYLLFFFAYLFWNYFLHSDLMGSFLVTFIVPILVEAFFNTQYGIALFVFFFFLIKGIPQPVVTTAEQ